MNVLADWCEHGLRIIVVTQQIELDGPVGRMIAALLLGLPRSNWNIVPNGRRQESRLPRRKASTRAGSRGRRRLNPAEQRNYERRGSRLRRLPKHWAQTSERCRGTCGPNFQNFPGPIRRSVVNLCMNQVVVIFRKDRTGWKEPFALFPELPTDEYGRYATCYQHVGQHCSADYHGCIANSDPATAEEYRELYDELERRGYALVVKQRATPEMHERRRRIAAEWRAEPARA